MGRPNAAHPQFEERRPITRDDAGLNLAPSFAAVEDAAEMPLIQGLLDALFGGATLLLTFPNGGFDVFQPQSLTYNRGVLVVSGHSRLAAADKQYVVREIDLARPLGAL